MRLWLLAFVVMAAAVVISFPAVAAAYPTSLSPRQAEDSYRLSETANQSQQGVSSGTSAFSTPAFFGITLINLPTTRCIEKREALFKVSHRFVQPSNTGYDSFFGVDGPALILLNIGYGVTDYWSVSLGRTNLRDEVQLSSTVSLTQQDKSPGLPFSAVLVGTMSLTTELPEGADLLVRDNFRFTGQACVSRQFTDRLSLLVVPSFSSNTDYSRPTEENTFALGLGGRFMVIRNISLVGEISPVLSGYETGNDTWGLGIEVKKGGHVFHLFATNEYGLTPNQYLPGGDLKLSNGDVRFGFNIYRSFPL